jgi:NAD+ synthase (glutamine-hydrolysing)
MSVGYCTLYGDMAGGLAVISDLLKTRVFDLCRWINETTRDEIIPWNTINKPPSAELRPGQTDQQSLPPYPILDEIIVSFVEDEKSPDEIATEMVTYDRAMKYTHDTGRNLEDDVYWVCNTTVRNEHKRKQSATGLKLTKKMFKFGWEHPIVHKLPVRGQVKSGAATAFPLGGEKA